MLPDPAEALERAAELTHATRREMWDQVQGLPRRVVDKGLWDGAVPRRYSDLIDTWNLRSRDLLDALAGLERALRGVDVETCEPDALTPEHMTALADEER